MAVLLPEGKQSFETSTGIPLVSGKVYTYDSGTSTPRLTYADAAQTTPNANPVILDARGEATIFWSGSYKVILKDASDNVIWTVDGILDPATSSAALVTTLRADLASTSDAAKGAALVALNVSLVYPLNSVGDSLTDVISPRNYPYSATANGATDDAAALNAALASGKKIIDGGGRTYKINSQVTVPVGVTFRNAKLAAATLTAPAVNFIMLAYNNDCNIQNVELIGSALVNQYPSSQQGFAAASPGRSNVKVIGCTVNGCNTNFSLDGTSDSFFTQIVSKNAAGQSGVSEGYGLLAYQGASRNIMDLLSVGDARVSAKVQRRQFTAEYRRRILREADACKKHGALGALLRREGLYSSHLVNWRRQREQGELVAGRARKRGPVPKPVDPRVRQLEVENRRLQRKLARAETIITLQKQVAEILGIPLTPLDIDETD